MRKERVFTCKNTQGLSGNCELCGHGINRHDSDYKCLEELNSMTPKHEGHTKLPWTLETYESKKGGWTIVGDRYVGEVYDHSTALTDTKYKEENKKLHNEAKANAKFIVQAVNSHYELIEACKKIGDYCHRLHFQDVQLCFRECNQAGCIEIKKALALAGVKV